MNNLYSTVQNKVNAFMNIITFLLNCHNIIMGHYDDKLTNHICTNNHSAKGKKIIFSHCLSFKFKTYNVFYKLYYNV